MKPRHRRLIFIVVGLSAVGLTAALVLNAFKNNMVFFFSPSQVAAHEAPMGKEFRIGGLVKKGSLKREGDGLTVHFVVTDTADNLNVTYHGILPDLFSEGTGVVAQGRLKDGVFYADQVLAKHDSTYMPPEVASAINEAKAKEINKRASTSLMPSPTGGESL
jgi:cytochrome c-type biogenesis protein CcmE